jgi:hypothetical protein
MSKLIEHCQSFMQAQIIAQYSLNGPLTHIVALPDSGAVCLSNWGRSVFILFEGAVQHIHLNAGQPLINYGVIRQRRGWPSRWPPNEENGEFFFPSKHDCGALFNYHQSFGVAYDNALYLWDNIQKSASYLPITKLLPPHPQWSHFLRHPLQASYIADNHQIVTILSEYATHIGNAVGRMTIEENSAFWNDELYDIDFQEVETQISYDPRFNQSKTMYEQQIGSILAVDDQQLLVNAVKGYMLVGSPEFCAYNVLGQLNTSSRLELLKHLPVGRSIFASDRQTLLVRVLPPNNTPQLLFCDLNGACHNSLLLTEQVIGNGTPFNMIYDKLNDDLWLADTFNGHITHCQLIPEK